MWEGTCVAGCSWEEVINGRSLHEVLSGIEFVGDDEGMPPLVWLDGSGSSASGTSSPWWIYHRWENLSKNGPFSRTRDHKRWERQDSRFKMKERACTSWCSLENSTSLDLTPGSACGTHYPSSVHCRLQTRQSAGQLGGPTSCSSWAHRVWGSSWWRSLLVECTWVGPDVREKTSWNITTKSILLCFPRIIFQECSYTAISTC